MADNTLANTASTSSTYTKSRRHSVRATSSIRSETSNYRIVAALNMEWQRMAGAPSLAVNQWASDHDELASCASCNDVLDAIRIDPDRVLLALLSRTAAGEELAGRVVLQAMLGKVVRLAESDRSAQVDDYIAALWFRIRTYPVQRRPENVAANLALDTLKSVKGELRWTRRDIRVTSLWSEEVLDEIFTEAQLRADLDHSAFLKSLTAADVILLGERLGLVDQKSREVMLTVYADGKTGRDAAQIHRTTAAMVRFRCSRSVRRLAMHSTALVEAA